MSMRAGAVHFVSQMQRAADVLRRSKTIVFFSGAGISAESGIPTFRDKLTGLWAKHDPQRLETADAFRENPALVWGWYLWRRHQVSGAEQIQAGLVRPGTRGPQVADLAGRAGAVRLSDLVDLVDFVNLLKPIK